MSILNLLWVALSIGKLIQKVKSFRKSFLEKFNVLGGCDLSHTGDNLLVGIGTLKISLRSTINATIAQGVETGVYLEATAALGVLTLSIACIAGSLTTEFTVVGSSVSGVTILTKLVHFEISLWVA
jgi:hypothetical protein